LIKKCDHSVKQNQVELAMESFFDKLYINNRWRW